VFSRISGIQALGEIAKDSPRYHWQIMEVLAAFVRTNVPRKEEEEGEERSPKLPDDIQAALTVIGRRDTEKDPENQKIDLRNTNLGGANLMNAKLQRADFSGANLRNAYLPGANLQGAIFNKADLTGAELFGVDLRRANLIDANLQEAELSRSLLHKADIWNANLRGTRIKGADLLKAKLPSAKLQGANLSDAENLKQDQIELADGDSTTVLPDYVEAPRHWMRSE